jgi:hypothetical protein
MIIINIGHKCECFDNIGANRQTTSGTWTTQGRKEMHTWCDCIRGQNAI